MTIPEINADSFEAEVLQNPDPVLVDFFGPTCNPCVEMLAILGEIAGERTTPLKIVKFNAVNDPDFASRFRITSVPNFILFQNGQKVAQRAGRTSKREMIVWLDESIQRRL